MHKTIKITAIIIILLIPSSIFAQVPFAVTPTKVVLEGDIPLDIDGVFNYINGWPTIQGEVEDGRWGDIKIDGLHYRLTFWNVGELGGVKGAWFWKTDYKDADLVISYNVADNGKIWEKQGEFHGMPSYKSRPAGEEPDFKSIHYKLKFSGSPLGSFEELPPYKNKAGKPLQGALYEQGSYILFNVPRDTPPGTSIDEANPPLMNYFSGKEITVEGNPWFGWPEGSVGCEGGGDSGVRFADIYGQVEVYPDSDPEDTRMATMDDVLKVCDHIMTQDDSGAKISFADMTSFQIGPESNFVLVKPSGPKSKFSLIAGKIWANVKRMVKNGEMDITMNQAVAGIKGTTFVLEENGQSSTLKVIKGKVQFTDLAKHESKDIEGGEMITATKNGLQKQKKFNVDEEKTKWQTPITTKKKNKNWKLVFKIIASLAIFVIIISLIRKRKKERK